MAQIMSDRPTTGERDLRAKSCSSCCRRAPRAMPWTARCGICRPARTATIAGRSWWAVALPEPVTTAQTVVIGTPDQMAASAAALWQAGAKLLKVKLDDRLISERMVAIRAAVPDATLIVDANESWRSRRAGGALPAAGGPRCGDAGAAAASARTTAALENFVHPLPICADESCHTREQPDRGCAGAMRWSISNWIKRAA